MLGCGPGPVSALTGSVRAFTGTAELVGASWLRHGCERHGVDWTACERHGFASTACERHGSARGP